MGSDRRPQALPPLPLPAAPCRHSSEEEEVGEEAVAAAAVAVPVAESWMGGNTEFTAANQGAFRAFASALCITLIGFP